MHHIRNHLLPIILCGKTDTKTLLVLRTRTGIWVLQRTVCIPARQRVYLTYSTSAWPRTQHTATTSRAFAKVCVLITAIGLASYFAECRPIQSLRGHLTSSRRSSCAVPREDVPLDVSVIHDLRRPTGDSRELLSCADLGMVSLSSTARVTTYSFRTESTSLVWPVRFFKAAQTSFCPIDATGLVVEDGPHHFDHAAAVTRERRRPAP